MKKGFAEIVEDFVDSKLRHVHTMLPGKIVNYDADERKATVQILIKLRTVENELLTVPPISNVPVIFPSGKNFNMIWPLEKEDGVEVRFSEEGLGNFLQLAVEADGDSLARFSLTDAVCTPGLHSFKSIPDSKGTIEIDKDGNIDINKGSKGAAREDDTIEITAVTDPTFFIYLGTLTPPFAGSSITGKINASSGRVKIG